MGKCGEEWFGKIQNICQTDGAVRDGMTTKHGRSGLSWLTVFFVVETSERTAPGEISNSNGPPREVILEDWKYG